MHRRLADLSGTIAETYGGAIAAHLVVRDAAAPPIRAWAGSCLLAVQETPIRGTERAPSAWT